MIEKIKQNINNPAELERLYRTDRKSFESDFEKISSAESDNSALVNFWRIRLDFEKVSGRMKKSSFSDISILVSICLFLGILIKIPALFNINLTDFIFYEKNAGIIVFAGLTIYTICVNRISELRSLITAFIAFLIPVLYINLIPSSPAGNSVSLAYIHLPLLMWCIYGFVFTGFNPTDKIKRIEYIRYNGDIAILSALILISGGILTGVTIGLFQAIGISIEKIYFEYVVVVGLVSVPLVATYIIRNFPSLTNKIAPLIANIFSPLVLLTLIIYLAAMAFSGKDPYSDREFLLIFNLMLAGVMGIIVFSVSGTSVHRKQKFSEMILFILSIVTLIIDLIALSAIFYRLGEFGVTPNRLAIMGSNILILGNLVLIMIDLYKINFKKSAIEKVELTIAKYLPVYLLWTIFVVFGFPFIFGFK
jgi:hypothetical protein